MTQRELSAQEILEGMKGRWGYLFQDLAPELSEAMAVPGNHVPCPVHGGQDGFRLFRDYQDRGSGICNSCGGMGNGVKLLAWVRGYTTKDAFRDIAGWYRKELSTPTTEIRSPLASVPKIDPAKAEAYIRRVWSESQDIAGSPAERYLLKRGIWLQNISPILRFHPELAYYHGKGDQKKFYGKLPALIAPFRDEKGKIVCLHRIFITKEGLKADVPEVKKMSMTRGELVGSAIRLFQLTDEGILSTAEGIETSLAVRAVTQTPVWAAGTAGLLEKMYIPPSVHTLLIWEDLDASKRGTLAGQLLEQRALKAGLKVERYTPSFALTPEITTYDWLDVLQHQGAAGFPEKWVRCK